MDNLTNYSGMRLVLDLKDNEYFLFADTDNGPGLIHGKLGKGDFLYNVKRGLGKDGLFTGELIVDKFPFELTKYSNAKIEHLLVAPNDAESEEQSQTSKKVETTVDTKLVFELFDVELFEKGEVTNPPKSLSRKDKKKWYRESKSYKESKGKQNVATTIPEHPATSAVASPILPSDDDNSSDTPSTAGSIPTPEEANEGNGDVVSETVKSEPYCGTQNVHCKVKDYPEGYVIAFYSEGQNTFYVLGTPPMPVPLQGEVRKYFLTKKGKTADSLLEKLREHPYYEPFVNDEARVCKIHPVTDIPTVYWEEDALLVVDIYTLFNSKLFTDL